MEHEAIAGDILQRLPTLHPLVLLKKAIIEDTLRSHAFLISGGLWEGQMYWATILALLAVQMDTPGSSSLAQNVDMHIVRDDGERITVDTAKKLRTKLTQSAQGRRHIVIIENIERLNSHNANNEAANALLKVLEEPPVETLFLLTTSSLNEVLPTLISRVQVVPCTIAYDMYASLIPGIMNVGAKIELAIRLQEEEFAKQWNTSQALVQDIFNSKLSVTERILSLEFLYTSAKDSEKEEAIFSAKNIFFFQMELAIEERLKMSTMSKASCEELTRLHKNLLRLKQDFHSYINKKLAVEHFLISSFLPSLYE